MSLQTTYRNTPKVAVPGMIADAHADGLNVRTGFSTEASAIIPFGYAVEYDQKTGQGYDGFREGEFGVKLPNANTDKIAGILLHDPTTTNSSTVGGLDGMNPLSTCNIIRRGRVWVAPEADSSVAVGARLFVRAVATGDEKLGALRGAADSTDTVDCSNQGMWLTSINSDGLALLEVDFSNHPVGQTGPQGEPGEPG